MIEVRDLVKSHGAARVLGGASLAVKRGEVAVLIGPSGGGKSTLLRCINGLEGFEAGSVRVGDVTLGPGDAERSGGERLRALRRRVGMVFQEFHLFPHLSVLDNVLSGPLWALGQTREQAEPTARRLLEQVGMADRASSRPEDLSGGQKQRVAIARTLAVSPEVVLFDEPTSALDPRMAAGVLAVMADLARAGQTMIVVTHAMGFARRVAHTVHVMHEGGIAESGAPEQVFGAPRTEVTRSFIEETSEA
jgi:ABC-type polar amino acid transport system ATPase subunit